MTSETVTLIVVVFLPLELGIARNRTLLRLAADREVLRAGAGSSQTRWSALQSRAKVLATIAPSTIAHAFGPG